LGGSAWWGGYRKNRPGGNGTPKKNQKGRGSSREGTEKRKKEKPRGKARPKIQGKVLYKKEKKQTNKTQTERAYPSTLAGGLQQTPMEKGTGSLTKGEKAI